MDLNNLIFLSFLAIILVTFLFILKTILKKIGDKFLEDKDESTNNLELRLTDVADKIFDKKNKIILSIVSLLPVILANAKSG